MSCSCLSCFFSNNSSLVSRSSQQLVLAVSLPSEFSFRRNVSYLFLEPNEVFSFFCPVLSLHLRLELGPTCHPRFFFEFEFSCMVLFSGLRSNFYLFFCCMVRRSSQTGPGTTYPNAWTNANKKPLAEEQLWRQPAKMLDAQPVMMSLYPLPTWDISVICVCQGPLNPYLERAASCHQLRNQQVCFYAVIEIPYVPKGNGSHIDLHCGPARCPQPMQHGALGAELPLSAESHLPANFTSH